MYPDWSHFALLYQWLRKQAAVEVTRPHTLDEESVFTAIAYVLFRKVHYWYFLC